MGEREGRRERGKMGERKEGEGRGGGEGEGEGISVEILRRRLPRYRCERNRDYPAETEARQKLTITKNQVIAARKMEREGNGIILIKKG